MKKLLKKITSGTLTVVLVMALYLGAIGPATAIPVHAAAYTFTVTADAFRYSNSTQGYLENCTVGSQSISCRTNGSYTFTFQVDSAPTSMSFVASDGAYGKTITVSSNVVTNGEKKKSGTVNSYYVEYSSTLTANHTHTWNNNSYSASGNKITATCQGSGTCSLTKPTLTLNATGKTYDGSVVTASLSKSSTWTSQGLATPTINYSPANSKNAGTYTASVKVGNATATKQFTISQKEVGLTWGTNTFTYDGEAHAPSATATGLVSGDSCTVTVGGAQTAVGSYTATASALSNGNYKLPAANTQSFTINKKQLTLTGVTANSKVYDGTDAADLNTTDAVLEGVVEGDDVSYEVSGVYTDGKNVGRGKAIIATVTLSGEDAGNYEVAPLNLTADITKKEIRLIEAFVQDRAYNGNTSVGMDRTKTPVFDGLVEGDAVGVRATCVFEDKNVGMNKIVYVNDPVLNGTDKGNYELVDSAQTQTHANMYEAELKISGITVSDKVYDGSTEATVDISNVTYSGIMPPWYDEVAIDPESVSAAFADKNVGTDKAVEVTLELTGEGKDNYYATIVDEITADITAREVTVGGITVDTKQYDKTTVAPLNMTAATFDGIVDGDELTVSGAGSYADASIGENKVASISDLALGGADAGNYALASDSQIEATGTITKREISVGGITAEDKVYDGNTNATLVLDDIVLSGKLDGDDVSVNTEAITGAFETKDAGAGKVVILSGYELTGSDAGNYVLSESELQTQTTADIAQKEIGLIWGGSAFTYNGKEQAPAATATGLVGDDTCAVIVSGAKKDANAKAGVDSYTATATALDNNNYKLPESATKDFTIAQKEVGLSWGETALVYNGTAQKPAATATGLEGDDSCEVTVTGGQTDANAKAGVEKYTATATALSDTNYKLPAEATTEFTIAPKPITVDGIESLGKVYDGNDNATDTLYYEDEHLVGKLNGDDLELEAEGVFADPNVGVDKEITLTRLHLIGDDAGNYVLAPTGQQTTLVGNIGHYTVHVTAENKTKAYGEPDPEFTYTYSPELIEGDEFEGELGRQEGEAAGEYFITKHTLHDHEGNYAIEYTHGVLTITQAKTNSVTAAIEGWTYGDEPNAPTATATHGQSTATFAYSKEADGEYTDTVPTEAGTWYVKATIAETDNYVGAVSEPVEFEIAKKEVGLTWGETAFTYNGAAQKPAATATGLVGEDSCEVTVTGEQTDANVRTGTEEYTAEATALSNPNYKLPQDVTTTFTIAPKAVIVSGITAEDKTYNGNASATLKYDGLVLNGRVGEDAVSARAIGTFDNKNAGKDKIVTISNLVLTGEDKDNYILATEGQQPETTATINKKPVTVAAAAKTKVFHQDDPALTYSYEPELIDGDSFAGELARVTGENVGSYEIQQGTLTAGDNYEITYTPANLTITQASNNVTAAITGWTYGDEPNAPTAVAAFGQSTATFTYSNEADGEYSDTVQTDAGTWYVKATIAETANYAGAVSEPVEFVIAKKEVGLTWGETAFTYNGAAQKPAATATGLVGEDGCEVIVGGEQTDTNIKTGTEKYTAEATGLGNANYKLPAETTKDFTIAPKAITISGITAEDKTYDGKTTVTLKFDAVVLNGKVGEDAVSVTANGAFADANAEKDKAVAISDLALTGDDKDNYILATEGQQTETKATINKKPVTVTAAAKTKVFSEADPALTYSYEPQLVDGDAFTGALTRVTGENVGSYEIQQGTLTAGDNYEITYTPANLTITQASNSVTAAITGWTYGDEPNAPTATAPFGQETATFTYSNEAEGEYADTVPTDAGTWYVKATIAETANYAGAVSEPVEFVIAKKEVGLTWGETAFTYTGAAQKPAATATGLVGEDSCEVIVGGEQTDTNIKTGTEEYTATATALGNSNYKLPQDVTTTFTIAPKAITVSDIAAEDKTYDGNTEATLNFNNVTLGGKVGDDAVTVTATGTFDNKNAGENKTVAISDLALTGDEKDNYILAVEGQQAETTATISKKPVTVTAAVKTKVFSEDDPALTYSYEPELVDGDSFSGALVRAAGEDVGIYEIQQGTLTAGDNYEITYIPANLTITQASNSVTAAITGWTYGDEPNAPTATAPFGQETATFTYSNEAEGEYSDTVPTDAGIWYVKATIAETANYAGAVSEPVEFEIAKKEVGLTWGETAFTYNGKAQKPEATATDLVGEDSCEVIVGGEQTDANIKTGTEEYTAEAIALSNPNYKLPEETTTTFTIAPKPITQDMLRVENDLIQGNGSQQGPTLIMTDGEDLVPDEDYSLSGEPVSDKTGTHFITIEGKGNYTDSIGTSWKMYSRKQNSETEKGTDGAGDIEIFVSIEGNTEAIAVDNFTMDFAKKLLTEEEWNRHQAGEKIVLYVEVIKESADGVSNIDQSLLLAKLNEVSAKAIEWFDIKVWKKIGTDPAVQLHELKDAIEMRIGVPDGNKNAPEGYTRTFYFGTVHNGRAEILGETKETVIAVAFSKFSTFTLAYKDTKVESKGAGKTKTNPTRTATKAPKTGDSNNVLVWICLMILAAIAFAVIIRRCRRQNG